MNQKSKQIIRNLGYRQLEENVSIFAKPLGYSCVCIDARDKMVIKQIFKGDGDRKLHIWDSMDIDEENLLEDIINFERYQVRHDLSGQFHDFSFATKLDAINDLLVV